MNQIDIILKTGVEYQNKIYASARDMNGLFRLDLKTYEIKYIKSFLMENNDCPIHQMAFLYKKEAWFIPRKGKYIAIVNLETLNIRYLEPPYRKVVNDIEDALFYSGLIIAKKYLCLIPTKVDTLLLIEMDTKNIYSYEGISEEGECYLYGAYVQGHIFMYPYVGRQFLELNLRTKEKIKYPWEYPFEAYEEVLYCNNKIWFTPLLSDHILSMDVRTKEFMKIPLGKFYNKECTYHQIVENKSTLFFIPFESDKIIKFSMLNCKLSIISLSLKNKYKLEKFFSLKSMVFASRVDNYLFIYDEESDGLDKIKIIINQDDLIDQIEKNWEGLNSNIFLEEGYFMREGIYTEKYLGLKKYIEMICKQKNNRNTVRNNINEEGIWNALI